MLIGGEKFGRMLEVSVASAESSEFIVHANAGPRQGSEVISVPRSIQEILDHADELAQRFEDHEPGEGNEVSEREYLLQRAALARAQRMRAPGIAIAGTRPILNRYP